MLFDVMEAMGWSFNVVKDKAFFTYVFNPLYYTRTRESQLRKIKKYSQTQKSHHC